MTLAFLYHLVARLHKVLLQPLIVLFQLKALAAQLLLKAGHLGLLLLKLHTHLLVLALNSGARLHLVDDLENV